MRWSLLLVFLFSASATAQQRLKPGDTVTMKVTAYCPCEKCCGKWAASAKTAIGRDARTTVGVAADPKLLPYRTRLEIPGVGMREVDDTGGAMRQSAKKGIVHIDLRMKTHAEAKAWGVQWLMVRIIALPKSKQKRRSS